jgi:hypothetical protein
LNKA